MTREDREEGLVPDTSDDSFLGGRVDILQPRQGYRAGIDAVFLAAAVGAGEGERIFEAGSGAGVAALCLAARIPDAEVVGVEVEPAMVALATENAQRNGLQDRARFLQADILDGPTRAGLPQESFDHVIANPPFFDADKARTSANALKARAHVFRAEDLDHWVRFMTAVLKPRGTMTMVHRAEALETLLQAFKGRVGDVRVFPLFPRNGVPASRVLVQGTKGSRAPLSLLSGLVLHGDGNGFTKEAERILRHGAALALS